MSHAGFGRADTGIHTVEGTLAGRRAAMLADKREKDQQAFEAKKRKIQEEAERSAGGIGQKFTSIAHDAFKVCAGVCWCGLAIYGVCTRGIRCRRSDIRD